MRKRNTIRIVIMAIILCGAFLVLRSAAPDGKSKSCNKAEKATEQCCNKEKAESADKTTWGNFSQQFFSSI